jgi:prepilin-type N-terminal cleavage/methylation domain-containing protein
MINRHSQRGMSLIELMIALVAGLVVIFAVLAFTVATVRANAATVQGTRLTQDMRLGMSLVMRELRRAGHDRRAELWVASSQPSSRFDAVTISPDGECIVIAYNRESHTDPDPIAGEWRGFRRQVVNGVGVIQANFESTPPDCASIANWTAVSDARVANISALQFDSSGSTVLDTSSGVLPAGVDRIEIRQIAITMTGSLVRDPEVTRTVTETVRIRADQVAFTPPPAPPPVPPPVP